ncbi:MAG: S-layer homology domain-containing protein [Candidatus Methanomethyliaceae archaeon]
MDLKIVPESCSLVVEQTLLFQVVAEAGAQPFDGVEIHLNFDPNYLRVVDKTGQEVANVLEGALPMHLMNQVDNLKGEINYAAGILGQTASGSVEVCSFYLKAISPTAQTVVSYATELPRKTEVTYYNAPGLSVLGEIKEARISISSGGEVAPSPTPTSLPTLTPVPKPSETPQPLPPQENPSFPDIAQHWASSYIERAYEKGILTGYPDGTFKPDAYITRAEFVVVFLRSQGLAPLENASSHFSDVQGHWASSYIERAYEKGILTGYPDGTFKPDQRITRAEISAIIYRFLKLSPPEQTNISFLDLTPSHWAFGFIERIKERGIITGYPDNTFRPDSFSTRAEAVVMIVRMIGL